MIKYLCPVSQPLDFQSARPLWIQLADRLRQQIIDDTLPPDRKLPSQTELEELFGVSRGTAARGVTLLRKEGRVVFTAGRGLFTNTAEELERLKREGRTGWYGSRHSSRDLRLRARVLIRQGAAASRSCVCENNKTGGGCCRQDRRRARPAETS